MMREFEKWVARVLLLNSALTLGAGMGLLGDPQPAGALPVLYGVAMLGFLSAALSLRRSTIGLWGGMLYYLVQVFSYFPYQGGEQFSVKAGLSIGVVMRFPAGVFVLNLVALAPLAATVVVWRWRRRSNLSN